MLVPAALEVHDGTMSSALVVHDVALNSAILLILLTCLRS